MVLESKMWDAFSTYLFIDQKLSTSKGSANALHSRFIILCRYFCDKDYNRDNFTLFLQLRLSYYW